MIICANFVFILIWKTAVLQCHSVASELIGAEISVFAFISSPLAHLSAHSPQAVILLSWLDINIL